VRVAKVHLEAGVDAELGVLRQLDALIPGQGSPQLFGQGRDGGSDGVSHSLRAVPGERSAVLEPGAAVVVHARQVQQLYDPVPPRPASTPGVKPSKGPRQPKLSQRLTAAATVWTTCEVAWYGQRTATLEVATGTALWHTDGSAPLPLRWVLVRNAPGHRPPLALFCTDPTTAAEQMVAWYVDRWHIETTFEEVRAHLGLETQREWSTRAVGRAVPCVLGLFSVVVLIAQVLHPEDLPTRRAAWYPKSEATFIDALAAVRRYLWVSQNQNQPPLGSGVGPANSSLRAVDLLVEAACYAA
jgi:hypothetical protein